MLHQSLSHLCRQPVPLGVNNVQLHHLVKQGLVPKRLASVFTYTVPASKTKSRVKTVEKARIITSEEVREEILASQKRKREGKKEENAAGKKKNTGGKKKLTSVAASKKASRKSAKSAFKKMILDKSDDEDSDSEPELSQPKRRRTVLLSDTEESGQEDDIGIVEESVGDINFAIGETTYVVELDINEISLVAGSRSPTTVPGFWG